MKVTRRNLGKWGPLLATGVAWLAAGAIAVAAIDQAAKKKASAAAASGMLTVELSGMIAVVDNTAPSEVTLLSPADANGAHMLKLAVDATSLDPAKSLPPDETVVTPEGKQLAVWHVAGRSLRLGSGGALHFNSQPILPLQALHAQKISVKPALIAPSGSLPANVGRVTLAGGTLAPKTSTSPVTFGPSVLQPGIPAPARLAEALTYSAPAGAGNLAISITGTRPGTITFKNNGGNVRLALSNHAPVFGPGMQHFSMYYTLLNQNVSAPSFGGTKFDMMNEKVMTCVSLVLIPK